MADSPQQMFRKQALDKLSSPEQLDHMMTVTGSRTWVALSALLVLLAAVTTWGFVGSVPTKVKARGLIIGQGGVVDVVAVGAGVLDELVVGEGDRVKQGQRVARLAQPELSARLQSARAELVELRAEHDRLTGFAVADRSMRDDSYSLQEQKLRDTIASTEERMKALEEQIANQEGLLKRGLVTRQQVLQARQDYYAAKDLLERSRADLKHIPVDRLTTRTQNDRNVAASRLRINQTERTIESLEQELDLMSNVYSPYEGRILEMKRNRGEMVTGGMPLLSLQLASDRAEGLHVVAYVPADEGKNVAPQMSAQISPSTAAREEYGFLEGRVTYVSEFPATREGMMRVLSNAAMVQTLAADGPPFAVYAEISRDPTSASGFKWSSPKGSGLIVAGGTLCELTITIRERRPIDLVIPTLRRAVGL